MFLLLNRGQVHRSQEVRYLSVLVDFDVTGFTYHEEQH